MTPEHLERIRAVLAVIDLADQRNPPKDPEQAVYMVVLRAPDVAALRALIGEQEPPKG